MQATYIYIAADQKIFPGPGPGVKDIDLAAFMMGEVGKPFKAISLLVVLSQKTSPQQLQ